ncbi:hypothetical protein [Robertmurraya massiliosenegalensis]|uniref:hypothetical protein n=1 Tax=Robertmurraya massiliosenegalensis TaxID=1287657 RepID=UPI000372E42C|nr:hypothetical protein [Robertmurraya massiliosenegalensis]
MHRKLYSLIGLLILFIVGCSNVDDTDRNTVQASTNSGESIEREVELNDVMNDANKNGGSKSPKMIEHIEMNIPESFIVEDKNNGFIGLVGIEENEGIGFGVGISHENVTVAPSIIEDLLYKDGAEVIEEINVNKYPGLEDAYHSIKATTNNQVEYALYKRNGDKVITLGGKIDNEIYNEKMEAKLLEIMSSMNITN